MRFQMCFPLNNLYVIYNVISHNDTQFNLMTIIYFLFVGEKYFDTRGYVSDN